MRVTLYTSLTHYHATLWHFVTSSSVGPQSMLPLTSKCITFFLFSVYLSIYCKLNYSVVSFGQCDCVLDTIKCFRLKWHCPLRTLCDLMLRKPLFAYLTWHFHLALMLWKGHCLQGSFLVCKYFTGHQNVYRYLCYPSTIKCWSVITAFSKDAAIDCCCNRSSCPLQSGPLN